jgi:hypothetical protein
MTSAGARDAPVSDIVVEQAYFSVVLRADGIVWLRRTTEVYSSVADVHRAYDEFLRVVDDWLLSRRIKSGRLGTKARTPMAWLIDLREAPVRRNDPEFESVVQQRRHHLLERAPLIGLLLRTASGRMQLKRMARTDHAELMTFEDLPEAVSTLLERMKETFGATGDSRSV